MILQFFLHFFLIFFHTYVYRERVATPRNRRRSFEVGRLRPFATEEPRDLRPAAAGRGCHHRRTGSPDHHPRACAEPRTFARPTAFVDICRVAHICKHSHSCGHLQGCADIRRGVRTFAGAAAFADLRNLEDVCIICKKFDKICQFAAEFASISRAAVADRHDAYGVRSPRGCLPQQDHRFFKEF